jgi:nucleotide-binding universal stress UspA family protein
MRFTRILVPLDGSYLAEAVLPAACSLAEKLEAQVLLVHVLEREPPATVHSEPHLADFEAALAYLEGQARLIRGRGLIAEVHLREAVVDDVAAAIDRQAHELDADLIAMCAHGRTNLHTRVVGSIAERVLRSDGVPILLRIIRRPEAASFALHWLLVPIDFGHDVEAALCAARTLAKPYHATVVLLAALERPPPAAALLLPATTTLAREYEREDLSRRLAVLATKLRAELDDVQTVVAEEPPTDAIIAASNSLPADLIVLVTDAHAGPASWYRPSTGQHLIERAALTLLLIKQL